MAAGISGVWQYTTKATPVPEYVAFYQAQHAGDRALLDTFFALQEQLFECTRRDRVFYRHDFENILLYYAGRGISVQESIRRIDIDALGEFYRRAKEPAWYPLDNTAKLYPLMVGAQHMPVFRISAYLAGKVVQPVLQAALTLTLKRFPVFATSLKEGFFWHYLERRYDRISVYQEHEAPCAALVRGRLLRVIYFQNRVSVEFYHVLTDGRGAMVFLKTLLAQYLRLLGHQVPHESGVLDIKADPCAKEMEDFFSCTDETTPSSLGLTSLALQLDGKRAAQLPHQVLHFEMGMEELKKAAKAYAATVTAYLLACILCAAKAAIAERPSIANRLIRVQVPVDMRAFYPTETLRNFSMYGVVCMRYRDIGTFPEVLANVKEQLAIQTKKESVDASASASRKAVRLLRYIPLRVKQACAAVGYGIIGDSFFTATLSNLGAAAMPAEMGRHIEKMDVVLGAPSKSKLSLGLISYEGRAVLTLTKTTQSELFENTLYALLASHQIQVSVKGSAIK